MLRSELLFFVVNEDKYHGNYHPQGRIQEFLEGGGLHLFDIPGGASPWR